MEKTKHTLGPWLPEFGEGCVIRSKKDKGRIAIMGHLKGEFGLCGRRDGNEVEANARLIAAAPELLEALQDIIDSLPWSTNGQPCPNAVKRGRTAIAKATGA